jgi:hypothetical protein
MTCNPRDIVHADSMLAKMHDVYMRRKSSEGEMLYRCKVAREWCLQYTPEKIKAEWKKLFAFLEAQKEVMV